MCVPVKKTLCVPGAENGEVDTKPAGLLTAGDVPGEKPLKREIGFEPFEVTERGGEPIGPKSIEGESALCEMPRRGAEGVLTGSVTGDGGFDVEGFSSGGFVVALESACETTAVSVRDWLAGEDCFPCAGAVGSLLLSSKAPKLAKSVSCSGGAGALGLIVALRGMAIGGRPIPGG